MSHLNVFSGTNSLADYFNPDKNVPTALVELPSHPFIEDGVHIYAKLMSQLPATNVKSLPALNMLQGGVKSGKITSETDKIIEYSSGSTVVSLGMIAKIMGINEVHAYLSNKTSQSKLELMRFFGLKLTLFGGPSQPEPLDECGGIHAAVAAGASKSAYNPNQYDNSGNYEAHMRWTGPQITRQLPNIKVFCACMGTSGTMTGTGLSLKASHPSIINVGVCTAPGDRIPGPRSYSLMAPVPFPWRDAVDVMEEVGSPAAFRLSMELCRTGIVVGPSSGMALQGLYGFLGRMKEEGKLEGMRGVDGRIECAFICCDMPYQYISEYFQKLPEESFAPITNSELIGVDQHRYLVEWELAPQVAFSKIFPAPAKSTAAILDFSSPSNFFVSHIPESTHIDLDLPVDLPNPFKDAQTLRSVWLKLEEYVQRPGVVEGLVGKPVVTICETGYVARIATSVLRARGVDAFCVIGGTKSWCAEGLTVVSGEARVEVESESDSDVATTSSGSSSAAEWAPLSIASSVFPGIKYLLSKAM